MSWIFHDGHAVNMDLASRLYVDHKLEKINWNWQKNEAECFVFADTAEASDTVAGPFHSRENAEAWIAKYVIRGMPSAECEHGWQEMGIDTKYEICVKCGISRG